MKSMYIISSILVMGWSKLEFGSPPKETWVLLFCNNSIYYCLEDCITGELFPCQRLSSKGVTNLSTKPVENKPVLQHFF